MSATSMMEAAKEISSPDTEDVALSLAGDHEAFRRIYERYSGLVIALIVHFESDWQKREDIRQTVFQRVFERLHDLEDPSKLKSWIGSITRNVCLSACRKARRDMLLFDDFVDDDVDPLDFLEGRYQAVTPMHEALRAEEIQTVRKALVNLGEPFRTLMDLYYFQDMPDSAISIKIKRPIGSVKSGLSRARSALRIKLSDTYSGAV